MTQEMDNNILEIKNGFSLNFQHAVKLWLLTVNQTALKVWQLDALKLDQLHKIFQWEIGITEIDMKELELIKVKFKMMDQMQDIISIEIEK